MEWIERVKGIIGRLRGNGKTEPEIEEIVQQAADKATVTQEAEQTQAKVAEAYGIPCELLTSPEYEQQYAFFAKAAGEAMRRIIEKIREAGMTAEQVEAALRMMHGSRQQESNNWRKLHGLPMRRKGRKRHGRAGRGCGHQ
ncbi:hypothetical protein [Eisenbergiella sp.]